LAAWAAATFDASPFLPVFCAIAFGYMIPDRVLDRVVKSRGFRLRHALPAALDMLVLAVEAGQSLDQAIAATSRGLKNTSPDLAAELTQLHLEARATNNRVEALRNLAIRNKEPELKKFTSLLIDTDRFGTSVGPALRDHAKYLRIRFRQQAQEAARKVGVKLIFPVFFLIFPSVILITLGPAVIMIFTQLRVMVGN
jgi:tight adherence protein C